MNRITINQRRFLIIWITIHSIALFTNIFNFKGRTDTSDWYQSTKVYNYVFTASSNQTSDFWPFTSFVEKRKYYIEPQNSFEKGTWDYKSGFNGIFYNYDISEYVFYVILALGIIFLPKLWFAKSI